MVIIIKNSQKYFIEQQKRLAELDGVIEEVYSGQNVIKVENPDCENPSENLKLSKATTKTSYENYLFGIGDSKEAGVPYFNLAYSSNSGNMQIRLRVDGKSVYSQYVLVGEWIQFYVVKSGNTFTLYIDPMCKYGSTTFYTDYYKEVILSSASSINFTKDCNLGFASNEGCQNPGDYPVYYDDIRVYDYAFNPYPNGETNG